MLYNNYLRGIGRKRLIHNTDQWKSYPYLAIVSVSGDPIVIKEKNMWFGVHLTLQAKHMDLVKVVLIQGKPFCWQPLFKEAPHSDSFPVCLLQVSMGSQSGESNQMVHMNVLITCLYSFCLGCVHCRCVICYRDMFVRKNRKIHKDAESAQSCTDSSGSFAKLNEFSLTALSRNINKISILPKLYVTCWPVGRLPPNGDTKSMVMDHRGQPPWVGCSPHSWVYTCASPEDPAGHEEPLRKAHGHGASRKKPQFFNRVLHPFPTKSRAYPQCHCSS